MVSNLEEADHTTENHELNCRPVTLSENTMARNLEGWPLKLFIQSLRLSWIRIRSNSYPAALVQFSLSVVSDSLQAHESQNARPPGSSPTAGVHSNSSSLSQWCHPAISSSVVPFSCPQSLPALESFPMSQLIPWGGQSIGVLASTLVLPMNTQDWSP